ncbi:5-carboxymethyl-2-hydroxymuconate Delta-isomerase [Castellaniella caeni]
MPHLTIEYSANLRTQTDMPALLKHLSDVLQAVRSAEGEHIYPLGGIRVRAIPCEDYCIAGGQVPEAGFVHGALRIGGGRSLDVLKTTGDQVFDAIKAHFAPLFERQPLALSFVIDEFAPPGSWKQNNLHRLLKKD